MDGREIVVPLLDQDNTRAMLINSLRNRREILGLRKNDFGEYKPLYAGISPSRVIKTEGYREPKHGSLTTPQIKKMDTHYSFEVIRYFAEYCYHFLKNNGYNLDDPVCKIIRRFANPNLTGRDLEFIMKSNDEQLTRIANGEKSPLQAFIYEVINKPISSEDHFSSDDLYKPSIPPDKEEKRGLTDERGISKRIYMNPPRLSKIHYEFALLFIKKCIQNGIPFDMKLFGAYSHDSLINSADGAVFYSRNAYYQKHIEIIEEIFRAHPEFKEYYGSPIASAGNIVDADGKSYMAICHDGVSTSGGETYNDTVDRIIACSTIYACCKYIINHPSDFPEIDSLTMKRIEEVVSRPIDEKTLLEDFSVVAREGEKKTLRSTVGDAVYKHRLFIWTRRNPKSKEKIDQIDAELCDYFDECFPLFKSLVTFGDTDHTDVPIYMDGKFHAVRERDKETSSVGSAKR